MIECVHEGCRRKTGFVLINGAFRLWRGSLYPQAFSQFIYLGLKKVLILDVFLSPWRKEDCYLFNLVVSKIFNLNVCLQNEMICFWFNSLEEMEKELDFDWMELNQDCWLIVVLIG